VAYAAHIGGFISGVVLINLMKNKTRIKRKISRTSVPDSK
jgi:membrane associated rhomboid family serine protease